MKSAMTLIFFCRGKLGRGKSRLRAIICLCAFFGCRLLAFFQSNWFKFILVTGLSERCRQEICQHYRNDADLQFCLLNLPQITN